MLRVYHVVNITEQANHLVKLGFKHWDLKRFGPRVLGARGHLMTHGNLKKRLMCSLIEGVHFAMWIHQRHVKDKQNLCTV